MCRPKKCTLDPYFSCGDYLEVLIQHHFKHFVDDCESLIYQGGSVVHKPVEHIEVSR